LQADLTGKVALVTGASKGIGRAIALTLAANGADIVANARNREPALEIVEEVKRLGRRASFQPADIWDYLQVRQMVDRSLQDFGRIDILVSSGAGGGAPPDFFMRIDPGQYADVVRSHLFSRLHCVRAVLDHMIERRRGKIILVTTDAGRTPTPRESLIGGAAAALVLMTKVIAQEIARYQIRINTICTTVTKDTPGYDYAMSDPASPIYRIFQKAEERMPFGMNRPADIAQVALFLASEDSNQITGQIFSVSGGLSFPG
jgi:2-hydroxycyclohexanecarboxyl-CoA dehydrogenase